MEKTIRPGHLTSPQTLLPPSPQYPHLPGVRTQVCCYAKGECEQETILKDDLDFSGWTLLPGNSKCTAEVNLSPRHWAAKPFAVY